VPVAMHLDVVQASSSTADISPIGRRVSCKRRISVSHTEHKGTMPGVHDDRSRVLQSSGAGPLAQETVELFVLGG
jgi:hypothetical protein